MLCLALFFPHHRRIVLHSRVSPSSTGTQHLCTTSCAVLHYTVVVYCIALHNTEYCSVWCNVLHCTTVHCTHCVNKNAHRDSIDYTLSNKEILFDLLLLFPFFSIPFPYIPSLRSSHLFCSIMLSLTLLCSLVLFCSALLLSPPLSLTLLSFSLLCLPVILCTVLFCPDPEAAVHRPEGPSAERITHVARTYAAALGLESRAR